MPLFRVETARREGETDREIIVRLRKEAQPAIDELQNRKDVRIEFWNRPSFEQIVNGGCILRWKYKQYPR